MRQLGRSLGWGLAVALVVALGVTLLEWYENPGGIFRGDTGTQWHYVWETAWSWFAPTFLYGVAIAWLAQLVYAGYKRTRGRMGW